MVPQAHKVLLELMTNKQTKDNIRQGIAQFVIEEGKQFLSDFFDEEEEHEEDKPQEVEEDDEEDDEFASPLSTEIKK